MIKILDKLNYKNKNIKSNIQNILGTSIEGLQEIANSNLVFSSSFFRENETSSA